MVPYIFTGLTLLVMIFSLILFYVRGKKALSIFPDINSIEVVFSDKHASGYSTKSWQTKHGGAIKTLHIVITKHELWLKSNTIFADIAKRNDLLHKIPLNKILSIETKKKAITIVFQTENGEQSQFVLYTKKFNDFLKAIPKI